MNFQYIEPLIQMALNEDLGWGDITSDNLIDPSWKNNFEIILKQDGIIAGLPLVEYILKKLDPDLEWEEFHKDGSWLEGGTKLARVRGHAQSVLKGERVALNFLQRLSGIATMTNHFVQKAKIGSETVRVVDTRKTTPGCRYLEKYAVRMGGGHNHRYNLSDSVLVKDNHLAILKKEGISLKDTLEKIREQVPHTMRVEVEVESINQIDDVLEGGADVILLDNMNEHELRNAVQKIDNRAITEASGGVSLHTIIQIAKTGVDIISIGGLTHSAPSLDISIEIE